MSVPFSDGNYRHPELTCCGHEPRVTFSGTNTDAVKITLNGHCGFVSREEIAALAQLFPVKPECGFPSRR